jgi:hypothetical protein
LKQAANRKILHHWLPTPDGGVATPGIYTPKYRAIVEHEYGSEIIISALLIPAER